MDAARSVLNALSRESMHRCEISSSLSVSDSAVCWYDSPVAASNRAGVPQLGRPVQPSATRSLGGRGLAQPKVAP